MISGEPGFVSYRGGVLDDGRLLTVTVFEDKVGADASVGKAAQWIKENIASLMPNPAEVISGVALVRHINPRERVGYGIMRRYQVDPKNVDEIVRRVESGLAPLITSAPGFVAYIGLDAANGAIVSLSGFRDRATPEESNDKARAWVQANLGTLMPDPPRVTGMDIRFSKVK